jgi:hypothetical protein
MSFPVSSDRVGLTVFDREITATEWVRFVVRAAPWERSEVRYCADQRLVRTDKTVRRDIYQLEWKR